MNQRSILNLKVTSGTDLSVMRENQISKREQVILDREQAISNREQD
jgi:hypothetical protein